MKVAEETCVQSAASPPQYRDRRLDEHLAARSDRLMRIRNVSSQLGILMLIALTSAVKAPWQSAVQFSTDGAQSSSTTSAQEGM